jgi:hypothetical protein
MPTMQSLLGMLVAGAAAVLVSMLFPASTEAQTPLSGGSIEPSVPVPNEKTIPIGTPRSESPLGSEKPPKAGRNILLTAGQCRGLGGVAIKSDKPFTSTSGKTCYGSCKTVDSEGVIRAVCITEAFAK